jgi:hypothetical protein
VIPSSRLPFSVNPTANDTIAIGGKTFKFVAALGVAVAQVQVKIGGTAAATLANLTAAINGGAGSGSTWLEATIAFAGLVVADAVTPTVLRLRNADARGGNAIAGVAVSTALAASITGGASAWSIANLSATGKSPGDVYQSVGTVTITTAMITAGSIQIELPFAPTILIFQVVDGTGLLRSITDLVTISANAINVALAGGASPSIQNGDVFSFWAAA